MRYLVQLSGFAFISLMLAKPALALTWNDFVNDEITDFIFVKNAQDPAVRIFWTLIKKGDAQYLCEVEIRALDNGEKELTPADKSCSFAPGFEQK